MSVEVIIPTYRNSYWLARCLKSLADSRMPELGTVHVVDNGGDFYESNFICPGLSLSVSRPAKNLGWTAALDSVLPRIKSEFVLFLNDDTEFERLPDRLSILLTHFSDPNVAAVGPATGIAMGLQSLPGPEVEEVKLLIGFCMLVRREALERVGGLDLSFPNGGDDFDLCIRLADAGYRLILDRGVFVYHHAFKTGNRLYGKSNIPGGWNSQEMATDIYDRISKKHSPERLMELIRAPEYKPEEHKIGDQGN